MYSLSLSYHKQKFILNFGQVYTFAILLLDISVLMLDGQKLATY